jgi:hypothetical protein
LAEEVSRALEEAAGDARGLNSAAEVVIALEALHSMLAGRSTVGSRRNTGEFETLD